MTDDVRSAKRASLGPLVERAANGDRDAEAELCRLVCPAIRLFAVRRLGAPDAVDEFAQDVLIVLIESLRARRIEDPARIGLFVLGVCRNLARERARIAERRRELWERYAPAGAIWQPDEIVPRARLEDCLGQLTHRTREVLRRAFVASESHAEIAAALGLTEGNARVIRHRALAALRECLEAPVPERAE